jgi:hypothetical protein
VAQPWPTTTRADTFFNPQDHEKFVHFILSQYVGKEHELGIDPTVMQVKTSEAEKPQYDYVVRTVSKSQSGKRKIKNVIYRTDDLINGDGAKSLKGRGTRIWRVHEVVDKKVDLMRSGVLKDFWVDDDRKPEGEILEDIKGQPGLPETVVQGLRGLLLTPIAMGDVFVEGFRDSTCSLITRGANIPGTAAPFPLEVRSSYKPSHARTIPTVQTDDDRVPQEEPLRKKKVINVHSKFHHRVVFKEECVTLSKVTSLKRIFRCLLIIVMSQFLNNLNSMVRLQLNILVFLGLPLLHIPKPGWVHRDISVGNILIVPAVNGEPERTKLSDFEFAKRLDSNTKHEIRTVSDYLSSYFHARYKCVCRREQPTLWL